MNFEWWYVPTGLAILAAIYSLMKRWYWVGKAHDYMENHNKTHEAHNKTHEAIAKDLGYIRGRVDDIRFSLDPNGNVLQRGSPITLSDLGRRIADATSADSIIKAHIEDLRRTIQKASPSNAYQLQSVCINEIGWDTLLSEQERESVQRSAYQEGVAHEDVHAVLSILLRDTLLPEYGWGTIEMNENG